MGSNPTPAAANTYSCLLTKRQFDQELLQKRVLCTCKKCVVDYYALTRCSIDLTHPIKANIRSHGIRHDLTDKQMGRHRANGPPPAQEA